MDSEPTAPSVAEAADRLRAALAEVATGGKAKLYPADVRALLDFYDQHGTPPPQPEPSPAPALLSEPIEPAGVTLSHLKGAARDLGTVTERLEALSADRKFDQRITDLLLPLVRAMYGLLGTELDGVARDRVQVANDAYKALAAAQDGEDEAYHAAVKERHVRESGDVE